MMLYVYLRLLILEYLLYGFSNNNNNNTNNNNNSNNNNKIILNKSRVKA